MGPDQRVGICLDQSTDLAVAMLGVLKAGGAYLPLDPEQPPARLAFLLDDASADVVITSAELTGRLSGYRGHLVTDLTGPPPSGDEPASAGVAVSPDHLAYVIYTSGSTGTPKGVAVPAPATGELPGRRTRPTGSLWTAPGSPWRSRSSFDFAVTMFYLALATGGVLHLHPAAIGRAAGRGVPGRA